MTTTKIIQTYLTTQAAQRLGYNFHLDKENTSILLEAEQGGFIRRHSTTQIEWTEWGCKEASKVVNVESLVDLSLERQINTAKRLRAQRRKAAGAMQDTRTLDNEIKEADKKTRQMRQKRFDVEDKAELYFRSFSSHTESPAWEKTGFYYLDKYFEVKKNLEDRMIQRNPCAESNIKKAV